jgi:DNA-binding transcriptional ArsR family regulator
MQPTPCISQIATLLADPKRSAMLWALIDGTTRGADELASLAGVSASSAGAHLARLSAGGLLTLEARGRKRFFRLAKPEVGAAVEALASVSLVQANTQMAAPISVPLLRSPKALHQARLCGDHLGGVLAADLFQRMVQNGWLEHYEQRLEVTALGSSRLASRGIYTQGAGQSRAPAVEQLLRLEHPAATRRRRAGCRAADPVPPIGLAQAQRRQPLAAGDPVGHERDRPFGYVMGRQGGAQRRLSHGLIKRASRLFCARRRA